MSHTHRWSQRFPQVTVGSLKDWQKESQFRILNDKKEERGVKVIRDGVERFIDIKVHFNSRHPCH